MREEESNEFLLKMMESNRERIDYEIDDDLFDKCIFDRDGNLIDRPLAENCVDGTKKLLRWTDIFVPKKNI